MVSPRCFQGGVRLKTADETGGGCDAFQEMLITPLPPSRIFPSISPHGLGRKQLLKAAGLMNFRTK